MGYLIKKQRQPNPKLVKYILPIIEKIAVYLGYRVVGKHDINVTGFHDNYIAVKSMVMNYYFVTDDSVKAITEYFLTHPDVERIIIHLHKDGNPE